MMKKFALEEHIARPDFMAIRYTEPRGKARPFPLAPEEIQRLGPLINDEGEGRLAEMDQLGIERSILMSGSIGFDYIDDAGRAEEQCRKFNDFLLDEVVAKHPERYQGFAFLPFVTGEQAAVELRRVMKKPGCVGAVISGSPRPGHYIDEEMYEPFWEAAEETGAYLYIHPMETPLDAMTLYRGLNCLNGSTWSWGVDTGTYVLRMIFSGLFDRHPGAKVIMGHLAEMIPYITVRMDNRWKISPMDSKNKRMPSDYMKTNVWMTISGNPSAAALKCAIEAVGSDRIMFAIDYPFEPMKPFCDFIETVDISEEDREKICWKNAEKLFL